MDLHRSRKSAEQEIRGHYSATAINSYRSGSMPPLRSRNCPKQLPSTKGAEAEQLVKYMSNIPSYLQNVGRGNFKDKALNVRVLDQKYLDKWSDNHSQSCGDPQSSSCVSSCNSASGTSGQSCGSSTSPRRQTDKYFSLLRNGRNRFSEGWNSREKYNKDGDEKSNERARSCSMPLPSSDSLNKMRTPKMQRCPRDQHRQDCSPMETYRDAFLGNLLPEDVKFMEVSIQIPRSCPLSFSLNTDDKEFSSKESFKANNEDRHAQDELKSRTDERLLPTPPFVIDLNQIKRSSSLRDNIKGRQSPLRRILDPLLKPMSRRRSTSPVARTHLHKTSDTDDSLLKEDIISTEELSQSYDKQEGSTRQALLQLAWKSGLPLYMFSFTDNDILVATVSKKIDVATDDLECIYTIFSVQEVKKTKSGTVMNQGSKAKNNVLISNVVAQMKVSSRKPITYNSKSTDFVREFTLFDSRAQSSSCRSQVELAAVLVKDVKHNGRSLRNSIEAILPSGVHGLSTDGHPTPLIERWKSRGCCDCGGWDEGCTLRVFTDTLQAHDGTHQIELFLQGGVQEKKHAFRMVALKECLYTVDFGLSVGLVQAFAICIAVLHSKNSPDLSRPPHIAEKKRLQDHFSSDRISSVAASEAQVSYVPNHPPLSPYGRA